MSDKSNKYGYVGVDIPEQSFGNNKGVFNPAEINELVADNKWTSFGQLELIETQTVTTPIASLEFTNLGDYNVHFVTANNSDTATADGNLVIQLSNNGGSSYISSGYQYALQSCSGNGTFSESKSTSYSYMGLVGHFISEGTGESSNSYTYLYNLLDSTKYSFSSYHTVGFIDTGYMQSFFGSAVKPTAETHNAFRFLTSSGNNISSGSYSLYGIRYS